MIERLVRKWLLVILGGGLAVSLYSQPGPPSRLAAASELAPLADKTNEVFHPVLPGPIDGRIAWVTAALLQDNHYLRPHINASVSTKLFDLYLDAYDPQHIHFTQGDLAEFAQYRTNLDHFILTPQHEGDTHPACLIFNRFMERLEERVAYSVEVLKTEKFNFDSDERVVLNRHDLPYPKDLTEARKLWRDRVRAEYLVEELGKIDAKKKADKTPSTDVIAPVKPKSDAEDIVETLTRRYQRSLHFFVDWDHDDVLQIYLTTLAHVFDPHSDYMGKPQVDQFQIQMSLSLCGIGAELTVDDTGYCKIRRLLDKGPAMKSAKIKEGDRIVAVGQSNAAPVDIVDMNLNKAVQLIRGIKGTEVRLTLIPVGTDSGTRKVVSLIRDDIPLEDQAAKARLIELPDGHGGNTRLGFIDLPSFYASFDLTGSRRSDPGKPEDPGASTKSTTADVARLITKLKQENVQGVILDLRRNGGGSLEEAIRLTGLFIEDGPVVQVKDYVGNVKVESDPDPSVLYDGPLIVLTSRFSASASEILAGALQDYGRALIVGDRSTHGKGTVQMVEPLAPHMGLSTAYLRTNDPGALKLTIKKFYRPSGASTQKQGVLADIVLPSIWNESKEVGEASLENPLSYDTIPSARYDPLNLVTPYLPELRKRSNQRVAADREFNYVREDIDLLQEAAGRQDGFASTKRRASRNRMITTPAPRHATQERLTRKPIGRESL
jgi:carboxyl-terminal processing protease